MSDMDSSIRNLKGVGPKTELELRKFGVFSVRDLLYFYPRSYENWINVKNLSEIFSSDTESLVKIKIVSKAKIFFSKSGKKIYKIKGTDGKDFLDIVFFNSSYLVYKLSLGKVVFISGKIFKNSQGYQINSPKISNELGIKSVYQQTKNLRFKKIRNLVETALKYVKNGVEETLPCYIREKYNLSNLSFALENIHFPKDEASLEVAKKRLIFEEMLVWHLSINNIKKYLKQETKVKILKDFSEEFEKLLPFGLTKAQNRAIREIAQDMMNNNSLAMSRLIQGDVGSGKTVVAAAAAYNATKNGYQVAVMVPTELLSQQHYKTFNKIFQNKTEKNNIKISLLSAKMKASERKEIEDEIKTGKIDIVIGTNALISENLEFSNLGLVVADEQHRFGVMQRAKLAKKGENPHVLFMSATPIPRTLSMVLYSDLDISILDQMPPGRKEIKTFLVDIQKRKRVYGFLKKIVDEGGQGYIVCPKIEDSENGLVSVNEYKNKILDKYFKGYRAKILHSKMDFFSREKVMNEFVDAKIQILVSTTVIEVGVDVANANIIIIENAERFGLSQLHQLRGRVGRGEKESYCILISQALSSDTRKRLEIMCSTNDGFFLAKEDLKIRGPGEIFGSRQHGMPGLKLVKDLNDLKTVEDSKKAVKDLLFLSKGEDLKYINERVENIANLENKFLSF